jgi:hypothetical protein
MTREAKCQGICTCPDCVKKPSLKVRLARVNEALHALGLTYHEFIPVYAIDAALVDNGFNASTIYGGSPMREEVGEGKWLTAVFTKMRSGRWEVVAYVN